MKFEGVKLEMSRFEGGFDPVSFTVGMVPLSVYLSMYVLSFAVEMANNTINNYLRPNAALNEEKVATKNELFIQVVRRTIDNFIPHVLVLHYVEFFVQVPLLLAHFVGDFKVITLRFLRRILSPAYLATKGVKNVAAFYSAMSSGYARAKKSAADLAQTFKTKPKVVADIKADLHTDKEAKEAIKDSSKQVYEEIVKSESTKK
jgi:hypothetical protein